MAPIIAAERGRVQPSPSPATRLGSWPVRRGRGGRVFVRPAPESSPMIALRSLSEIRAAEKDSTDARSGARSPISSPVRRAQLADEERAARRGLRDGPGPGGGGPSTRACDPGRPIGEETRETGSPGAGGTRTERRPNAAGADGCPRPDLWRLFRRMAREHSGRVRGTDQAATRGDRTLHDPRPTSPHPQALPCAGSCAARETGGTDPGTAPGHPRSRARPVPRRHRRARLGHRLRVARPGHGRCRRPPRDRRSRRDRPGPAGGRARPSGRDAGRGPADPPRLDRRGNRDARLCRGRRDLGVAGPHGREHVVPVPRGRRLRPLLPDRRGRPLHVPARLDRPARHAAAHDQLPHRRDRRRHRRLAHALPACSGVAGPGPGERGPRPRLPDRRPRAPVRRRRDGPAAPARDRHPGACRARRRPGPDVRGRRRVRPAQLDRVVRPRTLARHHLPQLDAPDRARRVLPGPSHRDGRRDRDDAQPLAAGAPVCRPRCRLLGADHPGPGPGHRRAHRGPVRRGGADRGRPGAPGARASREQPTARGSCPPGVRGAVPGPVGQCIGRRRARRSSGCRDRCHAAGRASPRHRRRPAGGPPDLPARACRRRCARAAVHRGRGGPALRPGTARVAPVGPDRRLAPNGNGRREPPGRPRHRSDRADDARRPGAQDARAAAHPGGAARPPDGPPQPHPVPGSRRPGPRQRVHGRSTHDGPLGRARSDSSG